MFSKVGRFSVKWGWLLLLSVGWHGFGNPALGQSAVSILEQQLQQHVAQKNWPQAIRVIDQLVPLAPQQASQLQQYRSQLEALSRSALPQTIPTQVLPRGVVPIKRRSGNVPIVEVLFNNRRRYEMLVDSGASITTITRKMAADLGITSADVVQNVPFNTANGRVLFPIVYINAIEVGGLSSSQIPVAIAGPDLTMGLLGQNFLRHYDVSLRRDRIEFHDRR